MTERTDLSALVSSRICHDLISPIGAIGNGVELLVMDASTTSPEMELISDSVSNANARIRFFRIAFGTASPDARMSIGEAKLILSDLENAGRNRFVWTGESDLSRREVKLVFLIILCLETALAYGGTIKIERLDGRWNVYAQGDKLNIDPQVWGLLADQNTKASVLPAHVQFLLLPDEVQRQHRRLTTEIGSTEIRFTF
jgi:histidine phosphotransferase ChpT